MERSFIQTPALLKAGLFSQVLANVYLHYALDLWFEKVVKPRSRGEAIMCRYADDAVWAFRYREDADSPEQAIERRMDLPPDLYNGMFSVLLKNLDPGRLTVTLLAFTPRPTVLKMELSATGEETVLIGDAPQAAVSWKLRPQLGLMASMLVSDLPDLRLWILTGSAPAFLRFEGPLYFMGPSWRIDSH